VVLVVDVDCSVWGHGPWGEKGKVVCRNVRVYRLYREPLGGKRAWRVVAEIVRGEHAQHGTLEERKTYAGAAFVEVKRFRDGINLVIGFPPEFSNTTAVFYLSRGDLLGAKKVGKYYVIKTSSRLDRGEEKWYVEVCVRGDVFEQFRSAAALL